MKLTPFSKLLIAVGVLGGAGALVWHLVLSPANDVAQNTTTPTTSAPVAEAPSTGFKLPAFLGGDSTPPVPTGPLGAPNNPLKVSIVSFHGYAPALVANGNSLRTQPGSIFNQAGVNVEFVIQDDIPPLANIFESGTGHCAWRTSDFWAQEQPNLRNNKLDARAIMVVDNTRGADAVIARDPAIKSIEDLANRSVALLEFTPSHGMLIDAVENSSLSARKRKSVKIVSVNADEGTAGVRAAFNSGSVDAAVLWDPDLSLALQATPGAHVVYSTKTATNLIYDVIVCDTRHLNKPENRPAFQGFVSGWMQGVDAANQNPDNAVTALVSAEPFFQQLASNKGTPFVKSLFDNLVWTDLKDNVRILGLAGGSDHYGRVYRRFDGIYRQLGALANPSSPVINPQESFDYSFIKTLAAAQPAVNVAAAKPEFTFNTAGATLASKNTAALTKPVLVSFASGKSTLTERAKSVVNAEMVPLIENNGAAYFQISGNTDSTGKRSFNVRLSQRRAQAVVNHLVQEWEFPANRFIIVGNGPDNPLCNERQPANDNLNLNDCRARNRTTRAAVLSR